MNKEFWKDKKVLVTGHTGFKGSWLSIWLVEMGAKVIGYSLDPLLDRDNYVLSKLSEKMIDLRGDIRDQAKVAEVFCEYEPEIVFHLAAQPLVRRSYEIPFETYETNVLGTLSVLEGIRKTDATKIGVMITTDKCYENLEQERGYIETDHLGGYDPYSSSKACAEILIASYRSSFFNQENFQKHGKSIASVRAGNVIGGGDWAADRIIPDCMRALERGETIGIRNPIATRPWEHVLEPLSGYLLLAEKLYENPILYAQAWNFGPEKESIINVWDIAQMLIKLYGSGEIEDISNDEELHEAKLLSLDITKAKEKLGWYPKLNIQEALSLTVDWYKRYKTENVYKICVEQIKKFEDR